MKKNSNFIRVLLLIHFDNTGIRTLINYEMYITQTINLFLNEYFSAKEIVNPKDMEWN